MFLEKFQKWLIHERRSPLTTVNAYCTDIAQFLNFLEEDYDGVSPVKIDNRIIQSWLAVLMEQGVQRTSIKRKLSSVKTYYRFLKQEEAISQDPARGIEAPKPPKRLVKFIEQEEVFDLLDKIKFNDDEKGKRDHLILEILYGTGVRLSELIDIRIGDFKEDFLKVRGKGNKERSLPVNKTLKQELRNYIEEQKEKRKVEQDSFLLITDKGKPLYPMYVYRVVKAAMMRVSSISSKSPHKLRHAFATHLLNKGADLNAIKELLGHESLAASQVYTHNSIEKLKEVYKYAHPKADNHEN